MTAFELRIERLGRDLYDGVARQPGEPRHRVDLAILACFEDERPLRGLAALVDWRTAGAVSRLLREGFCTGRAHELVLLPGRRDLPADRIVLVGLGPRAALDPTAARQAATDAVAMALRLSPTDVLFALPSGGEDRELSEALLGGVVVGLGGELPREGVDVEGGDDGGQDAGALIGGPAPIEPATGDQDPEPAAVDDPGTEAPAQPCRWWVVADPRHAGRLRRLLEGPPRAAEA